MADVQHSTLYGSTRNHRPLGANDGSGTDQNLTLVSYSKAINWVYPAGTSRPCLQIDASGTTGAKPTWKQYASEHRFYAYDGSPILSLFGSVAITQVHGTLWLGATGATNYAQLQTSSDGRLYLDVGGKCGAVLPRLTTTQRDSINALAGMVIYNTTDSQFQWHDGSSWSALAGGGTLHNAYNFGGTGAGREIIVSPGSPVMIRHIQGFGQVAALVLRGISGSSTELVIGDGTSSNSLEPENNWRFRHQGTVFPSLQIVGKGSGVGDSNEQAMISIADDRTYLGLGNLTDDVQVDLIAGKVSYRGDLPADGQVLAYRDATGRHEWVNAPRLKVVNDNTVSATIAISTDFFLTYYSGAGPVAIELPPGRDGKQITICKSSDDAFDIEISPDVGGGEYFRGGEELLTLSGDYASVTLVFNGFLSQWMMTAFVGSAVFST